MFFLDKGLWLKYWIESKFIIYDIFMAPLKVKETQSATLNIFRFFYFLFKSFVKVELSYVSTINLFTMAENCTEKWIILKKQVCFSLVGNYLGPSNNYRQLILT